MQHQSTPQGTNSGTNTRPTCQICGRVGHSAVKCYNRFDLSYQPSTNQQAFASMQMSDPSGREWYSDSGALTHVAASSTNLQTADAYNGSKSIMMADGTYIPITHMGSVTLSNHASKITLNEILVCPDIKKYLLYVSKLCDDNPCGVYFDATKVCVIDLETQRVVSKGPRRNICVGEPKGSYVLLKSTLCS